MASRGQGCVLLTKGLPRGTQMGRKQEKQNSGKDDISVLMKNIPVKASRTWCLRMLRRRQEESCFTYKAHGLNTVKSHF
ncbi:Enamelin [Manis pentadactyla]|nr:Enamelin [Manis pentadactyla]